MTTKKAVSILMLSPVYFRLALQVRLALVHEFCATFPAEPANAPHC